LLTASLKDTHEEVRRAAQTGLDRMGLSRGEAVRLCAEQLGDSPYAEEALRRSGGPAVAALTAALGAREPATRLKAARTLGSLGEAAAGAAAALAEALRDKDPDVRLAAAKGLWNVTKEADAVVPALVGLLGGQGAGEARRSFLQTVLEALRRIGPGAKAAVPALTALAKDKNRHVQEAALSALREIAPAPAV
jgi:HEAT repeat protein